MKDGPGVAPEVLPPPHDLEQLAEERRRESDRLMWQVPSLCIAAQAFLYSRVFDPSTHPPERAAIATIGVIIALATIQLLMKHGYFEETYSWALDAFRVRRGAALLNGGRVFEEAAEAHAKALVEHGDDREKRGAMRYLRWRRRWSHRALIVQRPSRQVWVWSLGLLAAADLVLLAVALAAWLG